MYAALQRFLELKFADEKDTKRPKWSCSDLLKQEGMVEKRTKTQLRLHGSRVNAYILLYRFEGADGSKDARETGVKLEGAEGSG